MTTSSQSSSEEVLSFVKKFNRDWFDEHIKEIEELSVKKRPVN